MQLRHALLVGGTSILFTLGCGSDEVTQPTNDPPALRVTIDVVDTANAPVAGLRLGMVPDSPLYGQPKAPTAFDGALLPPYPSPFFPTSIVKVQLVQGSFVDVRIEDVTGQSVRSIRHELLEAGEYAWIWNGRDDAGAPLPAGVYWACLSFDASGGIESAVEERRPMFYAPFYADQYLVGVTDANGQIVVEDARLFPQLFDVEDFTAFDETATPIGTVHFGPKMRLYFEDPETSHRQRFDLDVTGSTDARLVWNPQD